MKKWRTEAAVRQGIEGMSGGAGGNSAARAKKRPRITQGQNSQAAQIVNLESDEEDGDGIARRSGRISGAGR